ncbi:F/Y-rich N-terminus-domain-containing protein [Hyaloraphidium curvatum]|nr:F/Y-rich N-terminus-domain-containing protein [Hyaloraphidium curvatum]
MPPPPPVQYAAHQPAPQFHQFAPSPAPAPVQPSPAATAPASPADLPSAPSSAKRPPKPKAERPAKPAAAKPKAKRVQAVPRDEHGRPRLPARVGQFTVYALGTVVTDRDAFHSARYVFPVGYRVSRPYQSTVDANATCEYFCTIEDGGVGPLFRVEPADAPHTAHAANSPTGAWAPFVKAANLLRNKETTSSSSGPEHFGLTNGTIQSLVQELPGVAQLAKYEWQAFEQPGQPKAAAKPRGAAKHEEEAASEGTDAADAGAGFHGEGEEEYESGEG